MWCVCRLMVLGLDQFKHLPYFHQLIRKFLLPSKTEEQIRVRIKNMTSSKASQNIIKVVIFSSKARLIIWEFTCNSSVIISYILQKKKYPFLVTRELQIYFDFHRTSNWQRSCLSFLVSLECFLRVIWCPQGINKPRDCQHGARSWRSVRSWPAVTRKWRGGRVYRGPPASISPWSLQANKW